ncbi:MAG: hypothetical protein ABIA74_03415 [bacterium]
MGGVLFFLFFYISNLNARKRINIYWENNDAGIPENICIIKKEKGLIFKYIYKKEVMAKVQLYEQYLEKSDLNIYLNLPSDK